MGQLVTIGKSICSQCRTGTARKPNAERSAILHLSLPPLPLQGLPEPLCVTIDFEADIVEEMLARLTLLRRQMLPPPT